MMESSMVASSIVVHPMVDASSRAPPHNANPSAVAEGHHGVAASEIELGGTLDDEVHGAGPCNAVIPFPVWFASALPAGRRGLRLTGSPGDEFDTGDRGIRRINIAMLRFFLVTTMLTRLIAEPRQQTTASFQTPGEVEAIGATIFTIPWCSLRQSLRHHPEEVASIHCHRLDILLERWHCDIAIAISQRDREGGFAEHAQSHRAWFCCFAAELASCGCSCMSNGDECTKKDQYDTTASSHWSRVPEASASQVCR